MDPEPKKPRIEQGKAVAKASRESDKFDDASEWGANDPLINSYLSAKNQIRANTTTVSHLTSHTDGYGGRLLDEEIEQILLDDVLTAVNEELNVLEMREKLQQGQPIPGVPQVNRVIYELFKRGVVLKLPPHENGKNKKPCWKLSENTSSS